MQAVSATTKIIFINNQPWTDEQRDHGVNSANLGWAFSTFGRVANRDDPFSAVSR